MSLELIYNCERERIRTGQDAIMCALHSSLLAAGLKCIGGGEELENAETIRPSDMLPSGWNDSSDIYALNYRNETTKDTFLLKVLVVDGTLYAQLMRHRDERVSEMDVTSANHTTDQLNDYNTAFIDIDQLTNSIKTQLIDPVLTPPTTTTTSSSSDKKKEREEYEREHRDPLRADPYNQPYAGGCVGRVPQYDPMHGIGSRDLDPLGIGMGGAGGGGMIFDPLRAGFPRGGAQPPYGGPPGTGIPRGSIPPGARFDPFGPPDLDPSGGRHGGFPYGGGPDPDHLPPPGYNNMFM